MPTVLRHDGYRFFFYSNEGRVPPHIHVERGDGTARYWLEPVELAYSKGFKAGEIWDIRPIVIENRDLS